MPLHDQAAREKITRPQLLFLLLRNVVKVIRLEIRGTVNMDRGGPLVGMIENFM